MNCKNCNSKLEGKFCSNCGQSSRVQKIDIYYLIRELNSTIFQLNHGLFYTIKQLFVSPGNSIKQFIQGKRKPYFKPIAYVLVLSTIYALVAALIEENTIFGDALSGWNQANTALEKQNADKSYLNWLVKNYSYTTIFLLPIFSLSTYISFSNSKYNYFEIFVLTSYTTGQQSLIYTFFLFVKSIIGKGFLSESLPVILSISYIFWTFFQFFNYKKVYKIILLTILTYFIYLIFILSLIFVFFYLITLIKVSF